MAPRHEIAIDARTQGVRHDGPSCQAQWVRDRNKVAMNRARRKRIRPK